MVQQLSRPAENAAEMYEAILVPAIYEMWATHLVNLAKPRSGDRALDVACGTGVVTRMLSQKLGAAGEVMGVDCDPDMIMVARAACRGKQIAPMQYEQASATSIPFEDDKFEVITCQQGLPYFSNRATSMREMYRVMNPGGRLAMLVWRGIDHSPPFRILTAILDHYLGGEASSHILAGFSMDSETEIHNLLMQSRFRQISIEAVSGTVRFNSVDEFFRSQVVGTHLVDLLAALDGAQRVELFTVLANALKAYVHENGLIFPMGAYLISAKK